MIPSLSSAAFQDGSYQPGRAYHTTHGDRLNFAAARARQGTLSDLFSDLGESAYENWDLQQGDVLQSFMDQ